MTARSGWFIETPSGRIRELSPAEAIYWENPPGPDWAARLSAAIRRQCGVEQEPAPPSPVVIETAVCPECSRRATERSRVNVAGAQKRVRVVAAPKPTRSPRKPAPAPMQRARPDIKPPHECAGCGREFGPDRVRHWFRLDLCATCHEREYGAE